MRQQFIKKVVLWVILPGVALLVLITAYDYITMPRPVISEQEAINNMKSELGISTDSEAESVMEDACRTMRSKTPSQIMMESPALRPYLSVIFDNAARGYCPEHLDQVKKAIDSYG